MSLPAFLRLAGPMLLTASTALFGTIQTPAADPPASLSVLSTLSEKYGLQVLTQKSELPATFNHGPIEGQEAAADEVASYAPILSFEWNLYPVDLIKRTRLKRIVLCKDLSYAKQKRTAIPDFGNDTLYLDVVRGRTNDLYVREVIHHEYYHLIDLRDDGKLYEDKEWTKLNPPDFKYGTGGKNAQNDRTVSVATDKYPGFLDRYAMTGVEEDKAEVFSHMMAEPLTVQERAAKDPVLQAKVERMKELMAAFCPAMDKKYWEIIWQTKREKKEKGSRDP
jgi:hypothetical protein